MVSTVAPSLSRCERPQHPDTVRVGPIVAYPAIEINMCISNRLLLEKVMAHDPHVQTWLLLATRHDLGQLLDDQLEMRKLARKRKRRIAMRTADIDDSSGTKGRPRIPVDDVMEGLSFSRS